MQVSPVLVAIVAHTLVTAGGHLLEPRDSKVIHCAGQSDGAFQAYRQFMGNSSHVSVFSGGGRRKSPAQPAMYMFYDSLKTLNSTAPGTIATKFVELRANLSRYEPQQFIVPQIGVSFTSNDSGYGDDVAAGLYDNGIQALGRALLYLGRPVLLRLGYEFNGGSWNGYKPASYRAAWARVVPTLRSMGVNETAFVWDATCDFKLDRPSNESAFYPGNSLVDWWGVNIFSGGSQPQNQECVRAFIDSAESAGYPVLLGESTPRYLGAGAPYEKWFGPYEDLIRLPAVKAACYIDWDWASTTRWPTWGDCRVEAFPEATGNRWRTFAGNTSLMVGAMTEQKLRSELGLDPS